MATKIEMKLTLSTIETKIDEEPVEALEQCRDHLDAKEDGHRKALYRTLQAVYRITQVLIENREKRKDFVGDNFWKDCKRSRPQIDDDFESILRFATRYVFKATDTTGPRYNRAYKYWRALLVYHEAGVKVGDIAARLQKDQGVDAVFAAAAEQPDEVEPESSEKTEKVRSGTAGASATKKGTGKSKRTAVLDDDDENVKSELPVDGEDEANDAVGSEEDNDYDDQFRIRPPIVVTDHEDERFPLHLLTSRENLYRVLGLGIGSRASLDIKRIGDDPNPKARYKKRFVVRAVDDWQS